MKQTALCVLLMISAASFFCGCGVKGVELSRRLIVEAIGIDKTDTGVLITLQALDTHTAGMGSDPNAQEKVTNLYQFSGETVGQALAQAQSAAGLTPLYSQARVLIFGRTLAEDDLSAPLDLFLREYTARSDILVAMAENTAEEISAAQLGATVPGAVILEDALNGGGQTGRSAVIKLYDFMNLTYSETDKAFCPVIGLRNAALRETQEPDIKGTAFFANGKLAYIADEALTRGLLFLKNRVKDTSLTVEGTLGTYTLRVVSSKTKITPERTDGGIDAKIRVKTVCDITEFAASGFETVGAKETADAEAAGDAALRELLSECINTLFYEKQTDICRFARLVNLKYPKMAERYAAEMFTETNVTIETAFTIRRTGKEGMG